MTDWVRDHGIDGFRIDTAKHVDPEIWAVLKREAEFALAQWRARNPDRIRPDRPFYMFGEVFNYGVAGFQNAAEEGLAYDYGDRQVDFYELGFDALINMGFATHAAQPAGALFAQYHQELQGRFAGKGVVNYISSHDDMGPLDPARKDAFNAAIKLMLAPGRRRSTTATNFHAVWWSPAPRAMRPCARRWTGWRSRSKPRYSPIGASSDSSASVFRPWAPACIRNCKPGRWSSRARSTAPRRRWWPWTSGARTMWYRSRASSRTARSCAIITTTRSIPCAINGSR
ncbi:MAG: hypothetical protein IPK27_09965 [Rhodanobacteraceae bacterium]|nr:hypothetical protein [Rhodanobacteraceae bacterium]